MTSLQEYVDRMAEGQNEIYYINGPSRGAIENGPYVEMFKKRDIEILYTLEPIDDFVLSHLGEFDGKNSFQPTGPTCVCRKAPRRTRRYRMRPGRKKWPRQCRPRSVNG